MASPQTPPDAAIKYAARSISLQEGAIVHRSTRFIGGKEVRVPVHNVSSVSIERTGAALAWTVTIIGFLVFASAAARQDSTQAVVGLLMLVVSIGLWVRVRTNLVVQSSSGSEIRFQSRPFDRRRLETFIAAVNEATRQPAPPELS